MNSAQRKLEKVVNDLREMLSTVPGLALSEDEQVRLADYLETVSETIKDVTKEQGKTRVVYDTTCKHD